MTIFSDNSVGECFSGEQLLSYLYREMGPDMIPQVEQHFQSCADCVEAFAELSYSRYSVYEWQQIEFAPLETPKFVIPEYRKAAETIPYSSSLKALFAFRPRFAVAALVLAVIGGISGFRSLTPDTKLAKVEIVSEPKPPVAEYAFEKVEAEVAAADIYPTETAATQKKSVTVVRTNSNRRKAANVRHVTAQAPRMDDSAPLPPRLNEFQDLSDDGLRLTDLVAELETRE